MYASAKVGSISVACHSSFTACSLSVRLIAASTSARARACFDSSPYDDAALFTGAPAAGAAAAAGGLGADPAPSVTLAPTAKADRGEHRAEVKRPASKRLIDGRCGIKTD